MNTESKRITVKCNASDIAALQRLVVAHHGATYPEILRLGIHAQCGEPPPVVVQPQILPLPVLKQAFGKVNNLTRLLEAALRNGWPDHLPGESVDRKMKVTSARSEFEIALAELKPLRNELFVLLAACVALTQANIGFLKEAAKFIQIWHKAADARIKNSPTTPATIQEANSVMCVGHLLEFLMLIDIVSPDPAIKQRTESLKLDIHLLNQAIQFLKRSHKSGRTAKPENDHVASKQEKIEHLFWFLDSLGIEQKLQKGGK
jgi:hypothetical protein